MNTKKSSINFPFSSILREGFRLDRAIPLLLLIILLVFIFYPIAMIFLTSINHDGVFSTESYVVAFSSPATYHALVNTVKMVAYTLVSATAIGGSLALIRHRTDFKYKNLIDFSVFLSFTIPAYILSVTWVEVFSRGGYLNRIIRLFDSSFSYTLNAYTLGASAIILAMHLYPLIYYGLGNALQLLGKTLEENAKVCGANKKQILFRITLPLVLPAWLATSLLVVSRSMANFGVPAQLSLPAGKEVLSTRVFSAMSDLDLNIVAVLSVLLIAISMFLFIWSEKAIKKKHYAIKTSSATSDQSVIALGPWHKPVLVCLGIFFVFSIIVPFVTIITSSFFKRWGLPLSMDNLTINNYLKLFSKENLLTIPLLNSLFYGIVGATAATIIASLTVYFHTYRHDFISSQLIHIAQLPIAVPNMILAVAAMFAWINPPFKLYGTRSLIIITYTVLFIPICIKQILGASKNLDPSLDQAARTMGIPMRKRYTQLFLPQMKKGLMAGFLICFLISLKEIPISLLLYTSTTKTLGVMMFTIQSNSYGLEMTSSISVVVILLSVAGNLLLKKIASRGKT
ncbi:iron ABC transporter permease [Gottschalkiaceae bacterium SANA]|nr:iron ABC transporter permease [Gottschalkiaceae bacterium SANA]